MPDIEIFTKVVIYRCKPILFSDIHAKFKVSSSNSLKVMSGRVDPVLHFGEISAGGDFFFKM